MIADRYLERRFREGYIVGFKEGYKEEFKRGYAEGFKQGYTEGRAEGREENRKHTLEVLEQAGIELSPEVKEQLRNGPGRASK